MKNFRADPTASMALGKADRELKHMRLEAERIGERYRKGEIDFDEMDRIRARCIGIFKPILDNALRYS